MRRIWFILSVGLSTLLALLALLAAIGWTFSNTILVPKPYSLMPEFEIVAVGGATVTLPLLRNPPQFGDARQAGVFNLLYDGGYGRLGAILDQGDRRVVRAFEHLAGFPPRAGAPARLDNFLFWTGPEERGIDAEEITLDGEVGDLRAWWLDRDSDTAVLVLHGRRRGELIETLRIAPTLLERGYSLLAVAYRNHRGSATSPDGFYHYGFSEYRDVLTGLDFLAERGVSRVVLVGLSAGGVLALEALERWPAGAPEPIGLILDSPMLDPRTVFRQGARDLNLPFADRITDVAMYIARLRSGVDWDALDQRKSAASVAVPTLLIAGVADATVPIALVDDYAARVAVQLDYHRIEGADHVEGWNLDPQRYEGWVREFLAGMGAASESAGRTR